MARLTITAGCLIAVAAGCGGSTTTEERVILPVASVAPTTAAPTTTLPPTTIPVTTTIAVTTLPPTTVPETTLPPTTIPETTVLVLPTPAPPPEAYAPEERIEIGRIEIPKIGVDKPMFEGVTLTTLDHGPGHWPGTAAPGQIGNAVIAGHRVSHDKPFEHLDQLEPGDQVIFGDAAGRHVYQVRGTEIVNPDALWITDQTPERTATLFACHPKGSTKQRIVVHLDFVETQTI